MDVAADRVAAMLTKLLRFRWTRPLYDRLTCTSCGAEAWCDDDTGKVRRREPCSPTCPWRQAEELLQETLC